MTGDSDLLTVYNAYSAWRRVCNSSGASEQQFCRKNFLLQQNLVNIEELKAQLITCLVEAKFIALETGEKSALNKCVRNHHHEYIADHYLGSDRGRQGDPLWRSLQDTTKILRT